MLINCPSCDHQVSQMAKSCPSCGHPISLPEPPVSVGVAKGIMSIIAAVVGFALFYVPSSSHDLARQSDTQFIFDLLPIFIGLLMFIPLIRLLFFKRK